MLNVLLTGPPRCGKTTLLKNIIKEADLNAVGFYTEEVVEGSRRVGFDIVMLSGERFRLASKKESFTPKVGSYSVYVRNIDRVCDMLNSQINEGDWQVIVIDEIGKMELLSLKFRKLILNILETNKLLGTIMLKDNAFTAKIKNLKNTKLLRVDLLENEKLKKTVLSLIQ